MILNYFYWIHKMYFLFVKYLLIKKYFLLSAYRKQKDNIYVNSFAMEEYKYKRWRKYQFC